MRLEPERGKKNRSLFGKQKNVTFYPTCICTYLCKIRLFVRFYSFNCIFSRRKIIAAKRTPHSRHSLLLAYHLISENKKKKETTSYYAITPYTEMNHLSHSSEDQTVTNYLLHPPTSPL